MGIARQPRRRKLRSERFLSGKSAQYGCGEQEKCCRGGDGIPGMSEVRQQAAGDRQAAEHEGLSRLHAHAGEVKGSVEGGEGRFDEVEFAGRNSARDEKQIGIEGAAQCQLN
jgi:hypothetical protein